MRPGPYFAGVGWRRRSRSRGGNERRSSRAFQELMRIGNCRGPEAHSGTSRTDRVRTPHRNEATGRPRSVATRVTSPRSRSPPRRKSYSSSSRPRSSGRQRLAQQSLDLAPAPIFRRSGAEFMGTEHRLRAGLQRIVQKKGGPLIGAAVRRFARPESSPARGRRQTARPGTYSCRY